MLRFLLLTTAIAALPAVARADSGVAARALVVGSNAAGPGQAQLRYAEDDARRVGALLSELGGYNAGAVDVITHPTPASLREHLAKLSREVAADKAAGKQAQVFFYYSGHARATAIDLGNEPMPLDELRKSLFALDATLTVVVLDACQSGAFSRVKGAEPAADFSFNSRQQLDAKGVAVLASSTGSELSQESEQLKSSYFTHHLLVGMRGAGDANGDGQVSVDEAYRYAYNQTLLSTAATAVGGQHVTLEVDLKGHGEVALSYPRSATASIELPAALEGKALVQLRRAKAVVAETQKAKGAAVRIAVAPGDYEVLVRQGDRLLRCQVAAPGAVDLSRCSSEAFVDGTRKGGGYVPQWRLAARAGVSGERDDAFTQTLDNFGYTGAGSSGVLSLDLSHELIRTATEGPRFSISAHGMYARRTSPEWSRSTELAPLRFKWASNVVCGGLDARWYFGRTGYLSSSACLGMTYGQSRFIDQNDMVYDDHSFGVAALGAVGIGKDSLFGTPLGLTLDAEYGYIGSVSNDLDQRHDAGGLQISVGLTYRLGGTR